MHHGSCPALALAAMVASAALAPTHASAQAGAGADTTERTDAAAPDTTERWSDIGPDAVSVDAVETPVGADDAGPSVLAVQILLDRVRFSPGVLDGRWGRNTERAVYWYQRVHGLEATGRVDPATLERLAGDAGGGVVVRHTLTGEDVAGPFVPLPEDVYERAELECLCYGSLAEQLGERFHATPDLLRELNPGVDLNALAAGETLLVPDVGGWPEDPGADPVAELVISDAGHWLHALDDAGNVLYHFPAVLGADYAPSPDGSYTVSSITHDPQWHYKPDLLSRVPDDRPDAMLPPGPNNAVGVVWMQLSKPHYGIHGTSAPATVGYADSHGCVRLTNWDVTFLANRLTPGTPVRFVESGRRVDR